uniref:Tyrosine-protein phosphatase domain-containing protein n=1 Tax=Schistocephalus solidus TaxID=70667 RepID=A0A0X3NLN8_SCHSO
MGAELTKVIPGIYIGANENAKNEEELIANCISHILSVQSSAAESIKSQNHICYHVCVRESDEQSLLRVVSDTNDFIHSARVDSGNVLVHSVSGISANVAVVAAYLMSLYELDSRTAVSVLQGLVHAAQPVHHLQDQLDRFGAGPVVPSTPPSSSPSQSPQVTAASEHARLLEKYGPWPGMEADRHCIEAALSSHDDLKASGVFLGDAEEDAAAVSLDAAAAYLKGAAKPTTSPEIMSPTHISALHVPKKLPLKVIDRPQVVCIKKEALFSARSGEHADDDFFLEEDLDEPRNDLSGQEDPVEEDELSPATFPDEVGGDEGGSDGGDSEEEANEVVGSIPVPRGLMGAGDGGRQRFFAASYRPPPATKMASGNIDLGLDIASLMPDSDDRPAVHRTSQFATTAPAHGFFGWPM